MTNTEQFDALSWAMTLVASLKESPADTETQIMNAIQVFDGLSDYDKESVFLYLLGQRVTNEDS